MPQLLHLAAGQGLEDQPELERQPRFSLMEAPH